MPFGKSQTQLATAGQVELIEEKLISANVPLRDVLADLGFRGLGEGVNEDPAKLSRKIASECIERLNEIIHDDIRDRRGGRF